MLKKLRRWATLAPADRTVVAEAWLLLLVAYLSIRPLGLERSERLLEALLPRTRRAVKPAPQLAARLRHWLGIAAANHLRSSQCLQRSLVLRTMLARRGHDARVRIGVRRAGAELEAHAWVECDGQPLAADGLEGGGYSTLQPAASGR